MGIFLRGNIWWMEYRTRKIRKVVSTGFQRNDRIKAESAFAAFRLAFGAKPKRSAVEGILSAIYDNAEGQQTVGIPLGAVWGIYEEWCRGKGRTNADDTTVNKRNLAAVLVDWANGRKAYDISDMTVGLAREFLTTQRKRNGEPLSNKTKRTYAGYLSQMWEAIGQLRPGIHNPWKAAAPDNDGTSVRHEMFTEEQVEKILAEAKRIGHEWYEASMIALYTGLRYGDIATMQVEDIDFGKWIIGGIHKHHRKTRKSSGAEIFIPVAKPLQKILAAKKHDIGFLLPEHGIKYTAGKNPQPMEVPFSAILNAVGITGDEYGFHSFRHTANSRMAEAGIPSNIRQILCGWTNDEMARHYDHAKHLKELTEAVSTI